MEIHIGPHQQAGRRRRRGKALILCLVAAGMAVSSNWTVRAAPPAREEQLVTELVRMRNEVVMSPGLADIYVGRRPEYAPFILGEVETVEECFAVG